MTKLTREQFIKKLAPYAVSDMHKTGVSAALTIAQGILESADGNSTLTLKANNLFGIKGVGPAGSVVMSTSEYVNGRKINVMANFRKYHNWGESVTDHSNLFINGVSWNRDLYKNVIGKNGIEGAKEVAKAGYASDPNYADKLIKIIETNNLSYFDKEVLTMSEKERINKIEETLKEIISQLTKLEQQCKQTPPPQWFVDEFEWALEFMNTKTATVELWRTLAITLRIFKKYK